MKQLCACPQANNRNGDALTRDIMRLPMYWLKHRLEAVFSSGLILAASPTAILPASVLASPGAINA